MSLLWAALHGSSNKGDHMKTKSERREKRRRNARKMGVSGRGNKLIAKIIADKAEKVKEKEEYNETHHQ